MRLAILCLAALMFAAPATAQIAPVQRAGTLQRADPPPPPVVTGAWNVTYPESFALTIRREANGELTGRLAGKPCNGLVSNQRFTLSCRSQIDRMIVLIGWAARDANGAEVLGGELYYAEAGRPLEAGRHAPLRAARP